MCGCLKNDITCMYSPGDDDHDSEVRILKQDYETYLGVSESLQCLHAGKEMMARAAAQADGDSLVTMVWAAVDKFKVKFHRRVGWLGD